LFIARLDGFFLIFDIIQQLVELIARFPPACWYSTLRDKILVALRHGVDASSGVVFVEIK
jgi:hypothetical protein